MYSRDEQYDEYIFTAPIETSCMYLCKYLRNEIVISVELWNRMDIDVLHGGINQSCDWDASIFVANLYKANHNFHSYKF